MQDYEARIVLTYFLNFFIIKNFFYSKNYDFVPLPLPSRYRPITVPLPFSGHRDPW